MRFVTLIRFTSQGSSKINLTTKRAKDFEKSAKALGVHVQEILWTQGHHDGIILFEAGDVESASAAMLSLAAKGNVQTETMVAYDAAQMAKVLAKAK